MNRNQVLKIIADHRETLARDFGVKPLALFGSVVRNEANPTSDVDLLVEFDDRPIGLLHLTWKTSAHELQSRAGKAASRERRGGKRDFAGIGSGRT